MPWAQVRYQPERLAGVADGSGVTVAVIDSGVDAAHPQLRRAVLRGRDFLPGGTGGDGRTDCVAHGTAVASIIAAAPVPGTGFAGLAPGARILPIRVTETSDTATGGRAGTAAGLAQAITAAVRDGARVLNISMVLYRDDPRVRQAVRDAVRAGAVVVAAAGNAHDAAAGTDPVPYPAGYPDVLGVGAVDENGQRLDASQVGSYVDIVAPGSAVTAAVPAGGLGYFTGTSFAVPFVSATAALLLSRYPRPAAESDLSTVRTVTARITGSADPAPDSVPGTNYGHGVLNPYRAVAEVPPPPGLSAAPPAPGTGRQTVAAADRRTGALRMAGMAAGAAALVLVFTAVLARGNRRRWRPGRMCGETGPARGDGPARSAPADGRAVR
ncbi:MAG TPA: S8 family serine peptidase [Rugosimonospora sp.]|nr:S8 family serine peptidase [Rugosimonospora sp.]